MTSPPLPSPLPAPIGAAAWLADVVGREAAFALCEARGGTRLYVPHAAPEDGELIRLIGRDAAAALASKRGGEQIKVPRAAEWRVVVLRRANLSYDEIALRVGVTADAVWAILARNDMTCRQLSLFDRL